MIAAATAVALEAARRRQEEEEQLRAEIARRNAEAEAREAEIQRNVSLAHLAVLAAAAAAAAKAAKDKAKSDEQWPPESRFTQLPPPQAGGPTPPEDERPVHRPPLSERLSRAAEGRDQAVEPPQAASSFQGRHAQRAIETGQDAYEVRQSTAVRFHELESGHRSIRVDPRRVATGERIPFRQRWGFDGTRYTASSVRRIVALGRLRDVFSKGNVVWSVVASVAGNVYDYTLGEHRGKGLGSREF